MRDTVHLVLQGKGGVGKSLVAAMIAQYLQERGFGPVCADTDPVNSTFYQLKRLNVALIPMTEGGAIVQRLFDPLFETILETPSPVVIDNGSSTFLPMVKYLKANEVFQVMEESGKRTFIHAIITGGQAKDDTAHGLLALFELVAGSHAKVVVWQNEFWGIPLFNGAPLERMTWMAENADQVKGLVKIIDRNNDAFATDLRLMSEKHLTLADVKASGDFGTFAKSRIQRVFHDVFGELDAVFGLSPGHA
jgi:hypothetical protein